MYAGALRIANSALTGQKVEAAWAYNVLAKIKNEERRAEALEAVRQTEPGKKADMAQVWMNLSKIEDLAIFQEAKAAVAASLPDDKLRMSEVWSMYIAKCEGPALRAEASGAAMLVSGYAKFQAAFTVLRRDYEISPPNWWDVRRLPGH